MPDATLPSITAAEALGLSDTLFLDIRKPAARAASGLTVAGAALRDPFTFGHDDALTEARGPIIAFCVHGHEVSQFACALLLLHGRDARYVAGGFEALIAAGVETVALSDGARTEGGQS